MAVSSQTSKIMGQTDISDFLVLARAAFHQGARFRRPRYRRLHRRTMPHLGVDCVLEGADPPCALASTDAASDVPAA
jgi:hypothetical protein